MKKVKTIGINGVIFNIEEDAYVKLDEYLSDLEFRLRDLNDRSEILGNIEVRIGELFKEHLAYLHVEVVNINMVTDIITTLGDPQAIIEEELTREPFQKEEKIENNNTEEETKSADTAQSGHTKKIYRDIDHKLLLGVCSGLGVKYNIDAVVLRLLFVFFVIIFGSGIFLYLILGIIIPPADTAVKRLEMRGEEPNTKNIQAEIQRLYNEKETYPHNSRGGIGRKIIYIFLITFGFLLGLPLLLCGLIIFCGLFFPLADSIFEFNTYDYGNLGFIPHLSDYCTVHTALFAFSLIILIVLPVLYPIFHHNYDSRTKHADTDNRKHRTKTILLCLWIIAFFVFIFCLKSYKYFY